MPDIPETIVLDRHLHLRGRANEVWVRRGLLLLLVALLAVALLNVFGQRPTQSSAASDRALFRVSAPPRVRGGLIYQARFTIEARRELRNAALVLSSDWLEGVTVNTIEPSPIVEASRNGQLVLQLGHIPAGQKHLLFMEFQMNPTTIGRRHPTVALEDGGHELVRIHRTMSILP
jgi:hypothetical protein